MAPHSSTLAWKIPWVEESGRLQAMGSLKSQTLLSDFTFTFHFSLSCIEEGNGNPLQCSCLENPRDGGAWRAAIYGVAQSQTCVMQTIVISGIIRQRKQVQSLFLQNFLFSRSNVEKHYTIKIQIEQQGFCVQHREFYSII